MATLTIQASEGTAEALRCVLPLMAPPPRLTLSEWADKYRYLSPESCAEPGKWETARVEPARGIMDALSDPRYYKVVLCCASQLFKTEIGLNFVGYAIHYDP